MGKVVITYCDRILIPVAEVKYLGKTDVSNFLGDEIRVLVHVIL